MSAAEEQVKAASEFISEGDKLLAKVADPGRKKQISASVHEVRVYSQKLSEAFKAVLQNPRDVEAQHKLSKAQSDIGDAIQVHRPRRYLLISETCSNNNCK